MLNILSIALRAIMKLLEEEKATNIIKEQNLFVLI
jgi:hypothetical protein